ncbi:MAG: hypothetical protein FWC11_04285 [Firmicutes bacterium]|nr:hypothetical protein [Bacillota bacterium]MCL2256060.1 hypothetical protein [Bacillota bacterium]
MKKIKNIILVSMLFVLVLSFALAGMSGCALVSPRWRRDAVQAFRDARFAPQLEDVVPSFLLEPNHATLANYSMIYPMSLTTSLSSNYVWADDVVKADEQGMGFVTLEQEVNSVRNRINFANNLRDGIVREVGNLREYGEWIDGIRLDILHCGTIEHRRKDMSTGYMRSLVRLSADRSKVEIVEFPIVINAGTNDAYVFARYSSYDGEVFVHMDSYEFFIQGSEYFGSRHINYREYRSDENGMTKATLVQIGETLVDGFHGNPFGINTIDITVFGGNDEMIYRYWRRVNRDRPNVGSLFIENSEAWMSVGGNGFVNDIQASINMFDVARIFYSEEIHQINGWGNNVVSHLYLIVGVELKCGTIIEAHPNMYPWGGYVTHYLATNAFTSMIFAARIPLHLEVRSAVSALGFTLNDEVMCFNALINGDAERMLDKVRISRIENISDTEITIENAPKLFKEMFTFFENNFVQS